jgi:hypothetical protein
MPTLTDLFADDPDYAVEPIEGGAILTLRESESTYVLSDIDGSIQIRQMVVDAAEGYDEGVLLRVLRLMARINDRFTCTKFTLDDEDSVINCSDLPRSMVSLENLKLLLNQVEWLSQSAEPLFHAAINTDARLEDADLDAAFAVETLQ